MSILAFFLIVVSLLSFVAAQLILKRAMEFSATNGLRNSRFVSLAQLSLRFARRYRHSSNDSFLFPHSWAAPAIRP